MQSGGILKCFLMWEMSDSGRYEAILYACVPAFLCEDHFHRFRFVKRYEKQAFSQAVFLPSAGWLWASSHAGASHPYHVTLGSGLASVSWRRTKCLVCVQEAWCGANCPSQVHQSIVGLQCLWNSMYGWFSVIQVCVCVEGY